MKLFKTLGLAAVLAVSTSAASARPALWSFVGTTDRTQVGCLNIIYDACSRAIGVTRGRDESTARHLVHR